MSLPFFIITIYRFDGFKKHGEGRLLPQYQRRHQRKWFDFSMITIRVSGSLTRRERASDIAGDAPEFVGEKRKLALEMMERFGITELEALNILNGENLPDIVAKYDRIRNLIPICKDASVKRIEEMLEEYIKE